MSQKDYSWMLLPNTHPAWHVGFEKFIKHTFEGTYEGETAACPCCMCRGMAYMSREEVEEHVFHRGLDNDFIKSKTAVRAAEPMDDDDCNISEGGDEGSVRNLLSSLISGTCHGEINEDEPNVAAKKIFKLMEEGQKELYPGCKEASQVSFIVRLFQIKCMCGISNSAMEQILHLICLVLPEGHCVPNTMDKIQKVVRDLGLSYKKIHAYFNDCVLFRGEYENLDKCPICEESRWEHTNSEGTDDVEDGGVKKKVPRKVLRYFPLISRLQRLYMNDTTSAYMRWHAEELVKDGKVRHPADSLAWKHVDDTYPHFAFDPRNVRLGLASDGFNPFGMLNVTYTTWPVILIPYNLPLGCA